MSDEERSSYQNGSKKLDIEKRERLAVAFEKELSTSRSGKSFNQSSLVNHRTGKNITMLENVDGSLFHDIFEVAKRYLHNGELVDLQDNYDNTTCYISNDGLCGFAIEDNGNLVSVFNLGENGFLDTISEYVKNKGATHLDCYNSNLQPLTLMYERKLGFKTASIMDYNMEYDHDNIAKNHNMPKVAFMVNTNESQIYHWGIKKDTSLDGVGRDNNRISHGVSSDVSDIIIPKNLEIVNSSSKKSIDNGDKNARKALSSGENNRSDASGDAKSMTVLESIKFARENVTEYAKLDTEGQARVRRLIRQAKANGFTDAETRAYARVAARSGIDIVIDKNRLYRGDGKYADGLYSAEENRIYVNPEGSRSPARLLFHELTHALYTDADSKVWLDKAAKNLSEADKKRVKETYFNDANIDETTLSEEDKALYEDEISSRYIESVLDDDVLLEKLCDENPTLEDKIIAFLTGAKKAYANEPTLSREAKKLYKRYKTLFDSFAEGNQYRTENETRADKDEERFSLSKTKVERLKEEIDKLGKLGITLNAAGKKIKIQTDEFTYDKNIFSKKVEQDQK